jgi:hypothetical protein
MKTQAKRSVCESKIYPGGNYLKLWIRIIIAPITALEKFGHKKTLQLQG